jgi:hypothetical protein
VAAKPMRCRVLQRRSDDICGVGFVVLGARLNDLKFLFERIGVRAFVPSAPKLHENSIIVSG